MLCPGCRGKKTVAPLGAIDKQCSTCKGIGHVNDDVMIETPIKTEPDRKAELRERLAAARANKAKKRSGERVGG